MRDIRPGSQRRHARNVVMRIVAAQVAMGLIIATSLYVLRGWDAAYAALAGALIGVLPSYYLGNRIFGTSSDVSGVELLKQIYVAEMIKLAVTVGLFLITILFLDADFRVVLGTYVAVVGVNWIAMKVSNLGTGRHVVPSGEAS